MRSKALRAGWSIQHTRRNGIADVSPMQRNRKAESRIVKKQKGILQQLTNLLGSEIDIHLPAANKPEANAAKDKTMLHVVHYYNNLCEEETLKKISFRRMIQELLDNSSCGNTDDCKDFAEFQRKMNPVFETIDALKSVVDNAHRYTWIRTEEQFLKEKTRIANKK